MNMPAPVSPVSADWFAPILDSRFTNTFDHPIFISPLVLVYHPVIFSHPVLSYHLFLFCHPVQMSTLFRYQDIRHATANTNAQFPNP